MSQTQASAFAPALVAPGTTVTAGPWQLTVTDVQLGDTATGTVLATNAGNDELPAGLTWALAYVVATNTSQQTLVINLTDFAGTGTDGILRRPPAMVAPQPSLQGRVEPGSSIEGWVPFQLNDTSNVLLWFNSPFLGGDWADAWFALTDGATVPAFDPVPQDPGNGLSPDAPASLGSTVRAGDFDVAILDHISGQAVYDIADFGLRALGLDYASTWHAFYVRVTNVSNRPAFFSTTALRVTDPTGEPWDHLMALTPPQPDAARELLPGATREGWAAIDLAAWASLDRIRVMPFPAADEARYITLSGDAVAAQPTPEPVQDFGAGDVVELTDTPVNLRTEADVNGEIVAELDGTSTLTISGDKIEADGYTWYPVTVDASGEQGFVVANYLAPSSVE
jgi:hypothetical protein